MSLDKKSIRNIALYGLFAFLAAWVFLQTASFPRPLLPGYPGSAMFPRLTVVLMGLFSIWGLVREIVNLVRRRAVEDVSAEIASEGEPAVPVSLRMFAIVLAVLAAFVALMQWAGMEIAIFAFTAGMIYTTTRKIVLSVGISVASVAVVYFLFVQGLSVFLPLGFLPRYLSW